MRTASPEMAQGNITCDHLIWNDQTYCFSQTSHIYHSRREWRFMLNLGARDGVPTSGMWLVTSVDPVLNMLDALIWSGVRNWTIWNIVWCKSTCHETRISSLDLNKKYYYSRGALMKSSLYLRLQRGWLSEQASRTQENTSTNFVLPLLNPHTCIGRCNFA